MMSQSVVTSAYISALVPANNVRFKDLISPETVTLSVRIIEQLHLRWSPLGLFYLISRHNLTDFERNDISTAHTCL